MNGSSWRDEVRARRVALGSETSLSRPEDDISSTVSLSASIARRRQVALQNVEPSRCLSTDTVRLDLGRDRRVSLPAAWSCGTCVSGQDSESVLSETAMVIARIQCLFAHRQSSAAVASVRSVVVANLRQHLDVILRPIVTRRSSISLEKVSERLKHLAVPKFASMVKA